MGLPVSVLKECVRVAVPIEADLPVSSEVQPLDTGQILKALDHAGVVYVLVGGVACLIHGATRVTVDADLVISPEADNLVRVYAALRSLQAAVLVSEGRLRMEGGEVWEAATLRRGPMALLDAEAWHFTTCAGPVDVMFIAAGVGDYAAHLARAETHEVFGLHIRVAGLEDLIASKESLARSKDSAILEELYELRSSGGC